MRWSIIQVSDYGGSTVLVLPIWQSINRYQFKYLMLRNYSAFSTEYLDQGFPTFVGHGLLLFILFRMCSFFKFIWPQGVHIAHLRYLEFRSSLHPYYKLLIIINLIKEYNRLVHGLCNRHHVRRHRNVLDIQTPTALDVTTLYSDLHSDLY